MESLRVPIPMIELLPLAGPLIAPVLADLPNALARLLLPQGR